MQSTETALRSLVVRPLDPESHADRAAWGDLLTTLERDLFGVAGVYEPRHMRAKLASTPYVEHHHLGAFAPGGELVAHLSLELPLRENTDRAAFEVEVVSAWRGRGLGTQLADRARETATALGRPLLETFAGIPLEGDPDDLALPVNRLAARLGLVRRNIAVRRVLDLPLDQQRLADAQSAAAAAGTGYRIETFRGPVPPRWAAQTGVLARQLEIDEPDEEVVHDPAEYDAERMLSLYARRAESGADCFTALAVAPDGTLAGTSEVIWQATPGSTAGWQGITLVMPSHRGHRLGLAMKAATHAALADVAPGVRRVVTWNSHVNPHMIAVNEALGYVPAGREIAFQD